MGYRLLVGLGGVWVEALGDVTLLPVDADEARIVEALRSLRTAKLLAGFRGAPPADIEAVAQVVMAIGRLMQTVPELTEIDVNPLMVHAKGQGATALDALIVAERIAQRARRPTLERIEGTMTKQLSDRVAIVTGASNGTGRGIAEALAAAGAKTALAARRTEMLEEVASGIRDAGGTPCLTTDVTREDQVVRLFKTTYETYGRVDVLVNNAGVPTTCRSKTSRSNIGRRFST